MQADRERWDGRVILLHWLTAIAVLAAFGAAWTRDLVDDRALRATLLGAHRGAGMLALGLTLLRVGLRSRIAAPPAALPRLQALAARATHLALYALLLAQPLLGWGASSGRGGAILLFGLLPVPALPGIGRPEAEILGDAHAASASLFLALIGLHAAAALYHGLLRRDGVLGAMLPAATPRRA